MIQFNNEKLLSKMRIAFNKTTSHNQFYTTKRDAYCVFLDLLFNYLKEKMSKLKAYFENYNNTYFKAWEKLFSSCKRLHKKKDSKVNKELYYNLLVKSQFWNCYSELKTLVDKNLTIDKEINANLEKLYIEGNERLERISNTIKEILVQFSSVFRDYYKRLKNEKKLIDTSDVYITVDNKKSSEELMNLFNKSLFLLNFRLNLLYEEQLNLLNKMAERFFVNYNDINEYIGKWLVYFSLKHEDRNKLIEGFINFTLYVLEGHYRNNKKRDEKIQKQKIMVFIENLKASDEYRDLKSRSDCKNLNSEIKKVNLLEALSQKKQAYIQNYLFKYENITKDGILDINSLKTFLETFGKKCKIAHSDSEFILGFISCELAEKKSAVDSDDIIKEFLEPVIVYLIIDIFGKVYLIQDHKKSARKKLYH